MCDWHTWSTAIDGKTQLPLTSPPAPPSSPNIVSSGSKKLKRWRRPVNQSEVQNQTLHKATDDFREGCHLVETQGLLKDAQFWFLRASAFCQTALPSNPSWWRDVLWTLIWTNADGVNHWRGSAGASACSNQSCTHDIQLPWTEDEQRIEL